MSQRNGDRARADRIRNARLHQRARIRDFRKTMQQHAPKSIDPNHKPNVDMLRTGAASNVKENQ